MALLTSFLVLRQFPDNSVPITQGCSEDSRSQFKQSIQNNFWDLASGEWLLEIIVEGFQLDGFMMRQAEAFTVCCVSAVSQALMHSKEKRGARALPW